MHWWYCRNWLWRNQATLRELENSSDYTAGPEELALQALSPHCWVYSSFIGSQFQVCVLYTLLDTLGTQDGEGAGNCLTFTQISMTKQDYRGRAMAKQGEG